MAGSPGRCGAVEPGSQCRCVVLMWQGAGVHAQTSLSCSPQFLMLLTGSARGDRTQVRLTQSLVSWGTEQSRQGWAMNSTGSGGMGNNQHGSSLLLVNN